MASSWAEKQQSDPAFQNFEDQQIILDIQDLLKGNTGPELAASIIASNYAPRLRRGDTSPWALWTLLCSVIIHPETDPGIFQKLVPMLMYISKLPDVIHGDKLVTLNKRVYWRDLPEFSFYFQENAMNVHYIEDLDQSRTPISWSEQARRFQAANTFAAAYLCALDANGPAFELKAIKTLAKNTLMEALELAIETPEQIRRAAIYVPAASQWILISGRQIYDYSRRKECYGGEKVPRRWIGGTDGGENIFTGDEGFSIERWRFWAQRFRDVSNMGGQAMDGAADAAKMMVMIKEEHSSDLTDG